MGNFSKIKTSFAKYEFTIFSVNSQEKSKMV